ncbi:kinase-like protein [Coniochaeta sp. PMI_546]|nr:kinase-like protein [Coniochaeta sp. PMI_546]
MFSIAEHVSQRTWFSLWQFFANILSAPRFFFRLLLRGSAAVEQNDSPKTSAPDPPRHRRYRPIPGSWERKRHPHWPERVFKRPPQAEDGDIFYVTKGDLIRVGRTAIVELSPSDHVVKTPKPDPYSPEEEEGNRQSMEREASVYRLVGASPFIPELIAWDPKACTLRLKHCLNGDLESYIREPRYDERVSLETRLKWVLHAAKALAVVHAAGVTHNDVAPRNFLLDEHLDLQICDFAGSSLPGGRCSTCAPGPRYQSRSWSRDYVPTQVDDIFALGSVMYFILAGEEPYSDLDDEEVERRFVKQDFPTTSQVCCGTVIQDCWQGHFTNTEQLVQALARETRSVYVP